MTDKVNLRGAIRNLRRKFHLRLAQKRGLSADAADVDRVLNFMNDSKLQRYLERSRDLRWFFRLWS